MLAPVLAGSPDLDRIPGSMRLAPVLVLAGSPDVTVDSDRLAMQYKQTAEHHDERYTEMEGVRHDTRWLGGRVGASATLHRMVPVTRSEAGTRSDKTKICP